MTAPIAPAIKSAMSVAVTDRGGSMLAGGSLGG